MIKDKVNHLWYSTPPETAVEIHDRIVQTRSGSAALKYFDSSVMRKYQIPHKAVEASYCRSYTQPSVCGTLETIKEKEDVPLSKLIVKMSTVGEGSGRGLFAGTNIKKGSAIGYAESRYPVYFHISSIHLAFEYAKRGYKANAVWNYADGYGWQASYVGEGHYYVEPNVLTFSNHGCNGTFNTIDGTSDKKFQQRRHLTEQNAEPSDFSSFNFILNPYYERHLHHMEMGYIEASRDVYVGDELFMNYLFYTTSSAQDFYEESQALKRICNGDEVGLITLNEHFNESEET